MAAEAQPVRWPMGEKDRSGGPARTKVGRVIEKYELGPEYGDRLEAQWVGDGTDRVSLRDLADEFNRRVLSRAMGDAGMTTIEGEVENLYRLLSDSETTAGARTEARRRLEREGVDVEAVEADFVTYQAIRSYLRGYRGVELDRASDSDRVERTGDSIERLRSRLAVVGEQNLKQLRDADRITLGEFRLFVSVEVFCEDCGSQFSIGGLLDRGGCDCGER